MELAQYMFDKDKIKKELTIEDVRSIVEDLGGEPRPIQNNYFVSRTISHNGRNQGSWKLYYYQNDDMGIFKDYTADELDSFDVFELVRQVMSFEGEEWELPKAVEWVALKFGILPEETHEGFNNSEIKDDLIYLNNIDRINKIELSSQKVELKSYKANFLQNLPQPTLLMWEKDGITKNVCDAYNIHYDPKRNRIIIPHYDIDNNLIGIRERNFDEEIIEKYGKYRPATFMGQMYSHPLSFNLFGLNKAAAGIKAMQKAIVFEGEKSAMQYASYFGIDNCIGVSACGSNISSYQIKLLKDLGAKEIIIGFDREDKDDDRNRYVKKFYNFKKKYGNEVNLSFLWDKNNDYLDFKMSPTDKGKEVFLELYKRRIVI